jgi:twinfilin-like protein
MVHTLALPGLVNVHARDAGVRVDRRLEVHGAEEVGFEEEEGAGGKVSGRWRSLFLGEVRGTEGWFEELEGDREFWNGVV